MQAYNLSWLISSFPPFVNNTKKGEEVEIIEIGSLYC